MSFGLVTFIIASFEHAVALARGVDDIRQPEKPIVPVADMVQAHSYGAAINEVVQQLQNQFGTVRWPLLTRIQLQTIVDTAASAARRFEQETRRLMPSTPNQGQVSSLSGGWPAVWVTEIRVAQQPLEIIAGERSTEAFQMASDMAGELFLTITPVIGEAVLIYEAVLGRSVAGNRKLSNAERAAAGFGLIFPYIVGYSVKIVARAAAPVLTVTRRAVILALEDLRVYGLLGAAKRLPNAVEIAVGLRMLSASAFDELRGLLALSQRGVILNESQIARLNYFFVRMQDVSRLAQWLRIIDTELGSSFTGLQKLKGVKFKAGEEQALTALAQQSGDSVVALPAILPMDYPGSTSVPGATHPDGIWRGKTFDLLVLESSSLDNSVGEIGKKGAQSSTVVVALLGNAKLATQDIEAALPRIWGNPRYVAISEIVILDAAGLSVRARPDSFIVPFMLGLTRIGIGDPKQLARIVEALQAEPPEPIAPGHP